MAKKTGLASIAKGSTDLLKLDPRDIKIKDNWNSRDMADPTNIEHIDNLAKSIAKIGVKKPLVVYWENNQAWVEDGECRLRAALRAIEVYKSDLVTVPVQVGERYANEADRIFSQVVHNQGKPFSSMEQAKVFKRLLDMGWQQSDIAEKSGYSNGRVSQILSLLTLPTNVQTMITAGQVAASTAVQVVKAVGGDGSKAEQELKTGLANAHANGQTKVTAAHMQGEVKLSIKAAVKEAFEYCDIDDSDSKIIVIKMPFEHWEVIRKMCEL